MAQGLKLYLDTSAFLKLYLDEPESALVLHAIGGAAWLGTHLITYAEVCAGLARAARMSRVPDADLARHVNQLDADWATVDTIRPQESLIRRAGELAIRLELRGYDSVHLAAAEAVGLALSGPEYRVAVFDEALAGAVEALGMRTLAVD